MKTKDFVTRVLIAQEQVLLDDFWPTDDIYKLILYNANTVLEEFQDENFWNFLRTKVVLGDTSPLHPGDISIPEYKLPKWANRVSTLYQDRMTLHKYKKHDGDICLSDIYYKEFIEVPYASKGSQAHKQNVFGNTLNLAPEYMEALTCLVIGDTITFNRPLSGDETDRAAVIDVQREIPRFHICSNKCLGVNKDKPISYEQGDSYNPCSHYDDDVLDFMPAPDYIILKTAQYSADGSEIAQDLSMKLESRAKSRLSKIRELDSAATDVDQLEFEPFNILQV